MELEADEWVRDVTLDPNHPLAVLDAGSIPHILNLPPQRVGERARVVADRTSAPWRATDRVWEWKRSSTYVILSTTSASSLPIRELRGNGLAATAG